MQYIPLYLAILILALLSFYGFRLFLIPLWYRHCAFLLLKRDDKEGALEMFTRLINIQPQNGNALYCRGLLYREFNQTEAALTDFANAIEGTPNRSEPYFERARLLMDLERYDAALNDLNQAFSRHPYPVEIALTRSAVQIQRGLYAQAEEDCNWVLHHDPEKAGAVYNRGMARLKMNRREEAQADFELTLLMDPSLTVAAIQLVICYLEKEEYEKTIKICNRILLREPEEPDVYYYRAQAYRKLGKNTAAEEDEHKAKELGCSL